MGSKRGLRWGQREFYSATSGVRDTGYLGALKSIIGALCISMTVLGVLVQFHPWGPQGLNHRIVHGAVLVSAVAVGIHWLVRPWPTHQGAIAFVIWGDLSIATCAILTAAPPAQLNATTHMGLMGVFVAFMLGWRVLAVHIAFATAVIVGLTAWAVLAEHFTLLDLYIYYTPALSSVVVLPMIIQAVIEAGRRSIGRTARHAVRDPLTGLFNRRGMLATVTAALDTLVTSKWMAVAVVDLDRFKALNDTQGHNAGDAALRAVGQYLRGIVRHDGDLVARTGGDEFVVIAYLDSDHGLASFIDRFADLRGNSLPVSASTGIAWQATGGSDFDLETLLHHADTAMYEAKRAGGDHLVVHADSVA